MNPYLAIFRRDANTHNLSVPGAILYALIILPFTLVGKTHFAGGLMCLVTLIASLKIVDDLKLSDAHYLGFMLPNFKVIQFRYSIGLAVVSAIISVLLLGPEISLLERFLTFTLLIFIVSCLFLLVNKKVSIYIFQMFLAIILYSSVVAFIGSDKNFSYLIQKLIIFFSNMFDAYPVASSLTLWMGIVGNFHIAKKRYLVCREYDPSSQIYNWKKLDSTKNSIENYDPNIVLNFMDKFFTYIARLIKPLMDFVFFGRKQNPIETAIYSNSYYSKNWAYVFLMAVFFLVVSYLFKDQLLVNKDPKAGLTGMYLFLLSIVYAITISLEFLVVRKAIPGLWLMSGSKNRTAFMQDILNIFLKRHVRIFGCLSAFVGIFHYLAIGTDSLLDFIYYVLASLSVGFILPLCITLFAAIKFSQSVWLTILLAVFNIINYSIFSFCYIVMQPNFERFSFGVLYSLVPVICLFFAVRMWRNPRNEIKV